MQAHDLEPARHEARVGAVEDRTLVSLTLDQGDAFGVLAQARQLEAVARLGLVLGDVAGNERAADAQRQPRHHGAVDERREGHIGRDGDRGAAERERDRSADAPQDADEGREGEQRREEADGEIDDRLGREPALVGDALLRVRRLDLREPEAIIALPRQP
jgi:hypothetical protein